MLDSLSGASYYAASTLIVVLSLVPFLASFEGRRPQARELVVIAVLCAIAVASRAAFALIPSFKPMLGIVMVSGLAFGPQTGFLVGALSALISNFMFGQGPWTPWQMLAYGLAGLIFGVLGKAGLLPKSGWDFKCKLVASVAGFAIIVCLVGPLLDTCTLFVMASKVTPSFALAVYGAGLPFNVVHGAAVALTLLLIGDPLLKMLHRVRTKYGLMEGRGDLAGPAVPELAAKDSRARG